MKRTTTIVSVRLNDPELQMLDKIVASDTRGRLTRSEMIRLLIHREYNRRTAGTSKTEPALYQSDFRSGRPRKDKEKQP